MGIVSITGVNLTDQIKDAVTFYREMVKAVKKVNDLRSAGKDAGFEATRACKIEIKANQAWRVLSNADQRLAVDQLVKDGAMDPRVAKILTEFDGRVTEV